MKKLTLVTTAVLSLLSGTAAMAQSTVHLVRRGGRGLQPCERNEKRYRQLYR